MVSIWQQECQLHGGDENDGDDGVATPMMIVDGVPSQYSKGNDNSSNNMVKAATMVGLMVVTAKETITTMIVEVMAMVVNRNADKLSRLQAIRALLNLIIIEIKLNSSSSNSFSSLA